MIEPVGEHARKQERDAIVAFLARQPKPYTTANIWRVSAMIDDQSQAGSWAKAGG